RLRPVARLVRPAGRRVPRVGAPEVRARPRVRRGRHRDAVAQVLGRRRPRRVHRALRRLGPVPAPVRRVRHDHRGRRRRGPRVARRRRVASRRRGVSPAVRSRRPGRLSRRGGFCLATLTWEPHGRRQARSGALGEARARTATGANACRSRTHPNTETEVEQGNGRATMTNHNLESLPTAGTSAWLDDLSRQRLDGGELKSLVDEYAVVGVTTNPAIFSSAMTTGDAYDAQLRELAASGADAAETVFTMAIDDVR